MNQICCPLYNAGTEQTQNSRLDPCVSLVFLFVTNPNGCLNVETCQQNCSMVSLHQLHRVGGCQSVLCLFIVLPKIFSAVIIRLQSVRQLEYTAMQYSCCCMDSIACTSDTSMLHLYSIVRENRKIQNMVWKTKRVM